MLHFVGVLEIILAFFVVVVVVLQKTEANKWGLVGPIDANRWRSPPVSFRLCRNLTRLWTALIEDFFCTHYSRKCRWTMTFLLQVSQALKAPWPTLLFLHMWPAAQNSSPAILTQTTPPHHYFEPGFRPTRIFFINQLCTFVKSNLCQFWWIWSRLGKKKRIGTWCGEPNPLWDWFDMFYVYWRTRWRPSGKVPFFSFAASNNSTLGAKLALCREIVTGYNDHVPSSSRMKWRIACNETQVNRPLIQHTGVGVGGGDILISIVHVCGDHFHCFQVSSPLAQRLRLHPQKKKKISLLQIHTPTVE